VAVVPRSFVFSRLCAFRRSFRLTRGYFWKTLGVLLLTSIMMSLMVNLIGSIVLHFTDDRGQQSGPRKSFRISSIIVQQSDCLYGLSSSFLVRWG
jgi:hypothetical protein